MAEFTIGPDGLAHDASGATPTRFVDSFRAVELVFPQASVIGLRLYEADAPVPPDGQAPIQLRFSPRLARNLAHALAALADEIDGHGHPRQ